MNKDGLIREFSSEEEAKMAGFDTPLSRSERRRLVGVSEPKRHAALWVMRQLGSRGGVDRNKAKAARRARRKQRPHK